MAGTHISHARVSRRENKKMFGLIRLAWGLWLLGFFVLAVVATSAAIFAPAGTPARFHTWLLRLFMAAVWPIALFSRSGRDALVSGFRRIGGG
jgi:hypothetical protein